MQENQANIDTLPRNLLFMIALVTTTIVSYFLNSSLFSMLRFLFDIKVQGNFTRILESSSLWGIASYWSTFALLIFILAFLAPAISNIIGLVSLKTRLAELPRASDKAKAVTKETFLKTLSGFNLVYAEFAVPYAGYIVEKQEKDIRKKTNFIGKGKAKIVNPVTVSVLMPASHIFKIDRALNSRLSVWFMRSMPRVLMGIGFLLFILSFAGALQSRTGSLIGNDIFLMGVSSFALCMGVGVVLMAVFRVIMGHIHHRASEVVKMIENLFEYKPDENEIDDLKAVETALTKTVSSFKDVSKAINEKQEGAVNALIVKTLDGYIKKIGKATEAQTKALQKIVDDTSKQSNTVSKELSGRFDAYASKIETIQNNLGDHQDKSYEALIGKIETLITSLNQEVTKASGAVFDKNSILDDLNKTAGDLSTVSKASDSITKKFDIVAAGLDRLIEQVEKIAPMSETKRSHITTEIEALKNVSSKTVGMGKRTPAKDRKKA